MLTLKSEKLTPYNKLLGDGWLKKEDIVSTILGKCNLDYDFVVEKVENVFKHIDEDYFNMLIRSWNARNNVQRQELALGIFGRLHLNDALFVLDFVSNPIGKASGSLSKDKEIQKWKEFSEKQKSKGDGQMANDKLGIKIEPKLQLPQDENGKLYLGLYVGDKEINRIYVDGDFNLLGTETDRVVDELKEIKKVILAANGVKEFD